MLSPPLTVARRWLVPGAFLPGNWLGTAGLLARSALASAINGLAPPMPRPAAAPPVFIVGFWRSGTTLLHELLSLDPANGWLSNYTCMAPGHAHWTGERAIRLSAGRFESRRPMDNMVIRADSPQEDEFYFLNRGAPSFYELFLDPRDPLRFLERLDPADFPETERAAWLACLDELLGRISLPGTQRAILKSPTHSYRLNLLADRYPDAVFIHLHRDPVTVLLSTLHTWRANAHLFALDRRARNPDFEALALAAWHRAQTCTLAARGQLGGRWVDLDYHHLAQDPMEALKGLYKAFRWPGFEAFAPSVEAYRVTHQHYQTNHFDLSEAERARLEALLAPREVPSSTAWPAAARACPPG